MSRHIPILRTSWSGVVEFYTMVGQNSHLYRATPANEVFLERSQPFDDADSYFRDLAQRKMYALHRQRNIISEDPEVARETYVACQLFSESISSFIDRKHSNGYEFLVLQSSFRIFFPYQKFVSVWVKIIE